MAKKLCELCQSAPAKDMRAGVELCESCEKLYGDMLLKNDQACEILCDESNFPNATENARKNIILFAQKRVSRIAEAASREKTKQETDNIALQAEQARKKYASSIGIDYTLKQEATEESYEDVGQKLKGLAKTIFAIELCGIVLLIIVMLVLLAELAIIAFVVGAFLALMAWASYLFMSAFGQLVSTTIVNETHLLNILRITLTQKD